MFSVYCSSLHCSTNVCVKEERAISCLFPQSDDSSCITVHVFLDDYQVRQNFPEQLAAVEKPRFFSPIASISDFLNKSPAITIPILDTQLVHLCTDVQVYEYNHDKPIILLFIYSELV